MPSLAPRYFVDASGRFLGIFVGFQRPDDVFLDRAGDVIVIDGKPLIKQSFDPDPLELPPGAIEVTVVPEDGRDVWDGTKYVPHVEPLQAIDVAMLAELLIKKGLLTETDIAPANLEAKT